MQELDAREFTTGLSQIGEGWFRQVALGIKLGVPKALGLNREEWCSQFKFSMLVKERKKAIEELKGEGFTNRAIADVLGVDERTVRREADAANAAAGNDAYEEEIGETAANAAPDGLEEYGGEVEEPNQIIDRETEKSESNAILSELINLRYRLVKWLDKNPHLNYDARVSFARTLQVSAEEFSNISTTILKRINL